MLEEQRAREDQGPSTRDRAHKVRVQSKLALPNTIRFCSGSPIDLRFDLIIALFGSKRGFDGCIIEANPFRHFFFDGKPDLKIVKWRRRESKGNRRRGVACLKALI
jgi:hypothetical protein